MRKVWDGISKVREGWNIQYLVPYEKGLGRHFEGTRIRERWNIQYLVPDEKGLGRHFEGTRGVEYSIFNSFSFRISKVRENERGG